MALKNTRLARAENLSLTLRAEHNLPNEGLIIIESRNSDLKEKFIPITAEEGIWGYLKGLALFKEVDITE